MPSTRVPRRRPRARAMNCVGSPGTDPRHCSKLGRRRLSDRTNAAKSRDEGSRGRERDEGDRAQHRNLDPVPGACRPAIRRTDPDPLSWGSGQRDRPDPQRCVVRARRSDYRYPTITERDESASDAALRQRSCVEILALHDDDRVLWPRHEADSVAARICSRRRRSGGREPSSARSSSVYGRRNHLPGGLQVRP